MLCFLSRHSFHVMKTSFHFTLLTMIKTMLQTLKLLRNQVQKTWKTFCIESVLRISKNSLSFTLYILNILREPGPGRHFLSLEGVFSISIVCILRCCYIKILHQHCLYTKMLLYQNFYVWQVLGRSLATVCNHWELPRTYLLSVSPFT